MLVVESVGVRKFEDLVVWQLSHKLQEEVFALSATKPASLDRNFCDQIRDSSRSAPRNIAEGFARYYPKEFIRFLRIAAGSLQETRNHLLDAHERGYVTEHELVRLVRLDLRAFKAATRLIAYLRKADPPDPFSSSEDET
jgi:four helix bundle protein